MVAFLDLLELLEDNLEIVFVGFFFMMDDLLEFLNKFSLVFIFWVKLINYLLNFLLDGILSVLGDILFWIMVIVIFETIHAEELSINLAVSGQFCRFVLFASEKLSFKNRLGLFLDLMIFCLKMMICILDYEVQMI